MLRHFMAFPARWDGTVEQVLFHLALQGAGQQTTLDCQARKPARGQTGDEGNQKGVHYLIFTPRKRRLFETTNTLLNAMARAASMGTRNPSAAAGIRITL